MTTVVQIDAEQRWITITGDCQPDRVQVCCDHAACEVGRHPDDPWTVECSGSRNPRGCIKILRSVLRELSEQGSMTIVGANETLTDLADLRLT